MKRVLNWMAYWSLFAVHFAWLIGIGMPLVGIVWVATWLHEGLLAFFHKAERFSARTDRLLIRLEDRQREYGR